MPNKYEVIELAEDVYFEDWFGDPHSYTVKTNVVGYNDTELFSDMENIVEISYHVIKCDVEENKEIFEFKISIEYEDEDYIGDPRIDGLIDQAKEQLSWYVFVNKGPTPDSKISE